MNQNPGIPVDEALLRRIEVCAESRGTTPTEIVRVAFEEYESKHNGNGGRRSERGAGDTLYKRLLEAGVIGCIDDPNLPDDLSTNRAYFEGFGRE